MTHPASEFDYVLPPELIAQDPPDRREDSRLLLVRPGGRIDGEWGFARLPGLLRRGDLLVLNESRVFPARLLARRTDTGGRVEILLVEPEGPGRIWRALARPARRLRPGTRLELAACAPAVPATAAATATAAGAPALEVVDNLGDGQILLTGRTDPGQLAETWGVMPLPPYIKRDLTGSDADRLERDRRRYQTVYARQGQQAGSVAAPTAGLHFSAGILAALAAAGIGTARVCLHVGPGTFRSPDAAQIAARRLHAERFVLPAETWGAVQEARRGGGRVIAVGTTSLRVLETAARLGLDDGDGPEREFGGTVGAGAPEPEFRGRAAHGPDGWRVEGVTRLFIRLPDPVAAVDGLLTNFHLPGSSLLMLVGAMLGPDAWRGVYAEAVSRRLRFYSYGDCMLILPADGAER